MITPALAAAPRLNAARMKQSAPVLALAALGLAQLMWAFAFGYRFAGLASAVLCIAVLAAVALAYGISGRSDSLSNMAYFGMLWIAFAIAGAILTYIATTPGLPLLDEQFTQMDRMLGFHWLDFYNAVQRRPGVSTLLGLAYGSLLPQIIVAIIYLSTIGRHDRSHELWWTAFVTLAATAALSGLFPAAGTFHHYGVALDRAIHLPHFLALRDGSVLHFAVHEMQGIVTFPSYHAVLAILLTYAYRGTRWFKAAAVLNGVMLVSTPIYGGHYLVDLIGGAAIAFLSIWVFRRGDAREC
jgi:hypothetical protein